MHVSKIFWLGQCGQSIWFQERAGLALSILRPTPPRNGPENRVLLLSLEILANVEGTEKNLGIFHINSSVWSSSETDKEMLKTETLAYFMKNASLIDHLQLRNNLQNCKSSTNWATNYGWQMNGALHLPSVRLCLLNCSSIPTVLFPPGQPTDSTSTQLYNYNYRKIRR